MAGDPWIEHVLTELKEVLERDGVHAGLGVLNRLTMKRFTGVYRFDPPVLRNLYIFDRGNPGDPVGADAPMRETYCSIVGESEQAFFTEDASGDARLTQHPARGNVLSYCGALLRSEPEQLPFGTLCNFDLIPRSLLPSEIPLLEAAAPLIAGAVLAAEARAAVSPLGGG
jgi:GAF domain-containing protein